MKKYLFILAIGSLSAMADVAGVVQTAQQILSAKEAVEELVKTEKEKEKIYKKMINENEKRYEIALKQIELLKEINFSLKKNIELQNAEAKIQTLENEANTKMLENLVTSGADR